MNSCATGRAQVLGALLHDAPAVLHGGAESLRPSDVVEDSRDVTPGAVFIARAGASFDGRAFIDAARAAGASVILTDPTTAAQLEGAVVSTEHPLCVGSRLAHEVHGNPSRAMTVFGITGTNGKSTCAVLLRHVTQAAGHHCGLVGGIDTFDGVDTRGASLTTPAACSLARLLSKMRTNACTHVSMEVSSQGISTGRLIGTQVSAGVFTNLSGDHLDLHGNMETYGGIKQDWIASLPSEVPRIVNIDDAFGAAMANHLSGSVITCGDKGDAQVDIQAASLNGQQLVFRTPWGTAETVCPLIGSHNAMNALQAVVASCATGCAFDGVVASLSTAPTPRGRLQRVPGSDGAAVFVDFAHTDGALGAMLASVRELVLDKGRLVVVFGCGGDRDRSKRPRMAAVAGRLADVVWVTSDNPRTEDPLAIIEDVWSGFDPSDQSQVHREVDREAAIHIAIAEAGANDVVVIAGKGHERVQVVGDVETPFDDMAVAQAALSKGGS